MKNLLIGVTGVLISMSANAASTFKMYRITSPKVNKACDVFTKLVLHLDGKLGYAQVTDQRKGNCDLVVAENKRTYGLVLKESSCGTKIYSLDDHASEIFEVVDHRRRTCRDIVPARIILKEFDQDGHGRVLYSKDY